jgi:DNA-binding NtrC family response regulator
VDDECVISMTLAMILNLLGVKAIGFFNAEDALTAAQAERPQVLITDVTMPGMSGVDLAIRLKELCPEFKVLLFSGHASTSNILDIAAEQRHNFDLLIKPVHPRDLLAAIEKLAIV